MSTAIATVIVGGLSLLGTLAGSFGGMKLMTYRIEQLEKKVDKVEGKTLSSNDFTDVYKNKVDNTYIKAEVDSKLKDKVDKENGKGKILVW